LAFINSSTGNESNISAANGDLILDGSVSLNAGTAKLTRFNANSGRTLTVNGQLLGNARFVVGASGTTIINNTTSTWNNTGTGTSAALVLSSGTTLLRGTLGTSSAGTVAIGSSGAATAYTVSLLYDSAAASLTKGIALRVNNNASSSAIIGTGPGFTSGVYNITQTILLGTSTSVTGIVGTPSANLVVTAQDANATANFTGIISNGATFGNSVTKTGPGTVIFSANNTYNGPTTVSAGRLVINGNQSTATGVVSVNAGGTLGGIGTIGGSVTVAANGRLAPGASIGTLNLASSLTLADGALFTYELAAPGTNDRVNMTASTLTLNNQEFADFTFLPETGFGIGTYTLIDAGTVTGSLGAATTGIINFGGTDYNAALAVSGNDLVLNVAAIPEPSTLVLAGVGLLGFAGLRLRRHRQQA
jgi:autotransporter-associated beta strand protein